MSTAIDIDIKTTELIIFEDDRKNANNYLDLLELESEQFNPQIIDRLSELKYFLIEKFDKKANSFFWLDLDMSQTGGGPKDGIKAIKEIKRINPTTPTLVFTAYDTYKDECIEAGADFFITKNINRKKLLQSIENIKTILSALRSMDKLAFIYAAENLPFSLAKQLRRYIGYAQNINITQSTSDDLAQDLPNQKEASSKANPKPLKKKQKPQAKTDNVPPNTDNPPFTIPPVLIKQALITTPIKTDVDMTKEAKIYFGRKVLDYFEQIKYAAERKRAALKEEMKLDEPDPQSIPDLDIQDQRWTAGNQSWEIRYPDLHELEAMELSADKASYHFSIFYDEAQQLSQLSFTINDQEYQWTLNLEGIEKICSSGYNELIGKLPEQHKILLNLVIAKVCAEAYTELEDASEEQYHRIFKVGDRLRDEWKPEILKLIIQYYNKKRVPLETIKKALDNWHHQAGFPEVMDVLKGKIIEIDPISKEAKVHLSSFLYPSWNTEEYWESSLFENKGMTVNTCFLYTAIKLYGRIHAFDIDIVDFS